MRRRARRQVETKPTLVPMADMLSNTVGIFLFILAFTILSTGSAVVAKRLPMERRSEAKPIYFVCYDQRVLPLSEELCDELPRKLGRPTFANAKEWVARFNKEQLEDRFFVVKGEGRARFNKKADDRSVQLNLSALYFPKKDAGDGLEEVRLETSAFSARLKEHEGEGFAYFMVYPDSIKIFQEARAVASEVFGMNTGWGPLESKKPIRISLSRGRVGLVPGEQ